MTEPSIPLVFVFHGIILNIHKQESIDVDGGKCFVVAIENVKVMQNVEIHGLKTIRTLTFVQESGHALLDK